jgi:hypothetical protein
MSVSQSYSKGHSVTFVYYNIPHRQTSVAKIAGSGSGSINQRHGSADPDPDPPQNFMDPQHCGKPCWRY